MSTVDLLVDRAKAAGALRVYRINEVPASPGVAYMVLGLDSGTPTSTRADGRSPGRFYRFVVQLFGQTHAALDDMVRLADEAFNEVVLDEIDGRPFCRRELHTQPARDADASTLLYVLHTYRF